MRKKQVEAAAAAAPQVNIEHVQPGVLKPAEYNPRSVSNDQLDAICRSIVEFGLIDPIIARREDGMIIGGHQRFKAVQKLLSGPFTYKGIGGKVTVEWKLPKSGLPVVYVEGFDDKRAKMLNLALNRISGEWEHDRLAALIHDLSTEVPILELEATGFSIAELTDYIDIAQEVSPADSYSDGEIPRPSQKAPSLDFDFSTRELRDAVKKAIGAKTPSGELSGDVLARLLGITAPVAQKRRPVGVATSAA